MLTFALALALHHSLVHIPASDPHIRYIGRWDFKDPDGPRAEWPGSAFEIRISGAELVVELGGKSVYWEEEIDGKVAGRVQADPAHPIILALPDRTPHTYRFVKNTEAFVGDVQLRGIETEANDRLMRIRPPKHRLEVIGDSISCGYGDEGTNEHEHFKPETENADLTYGAIAARDLHADFVDIAWSGRKMWPDNTIPSIYGLTLPTHADSAWGFGGPAPDAIVINLATNDFGRAAPDQEGWENAYSGFIDELRTHYPAARIYLAVGTMMSDDYPPHAQHLTILRRYLKDVLALREAKGDRNCAIVDFGVQDAANDGLGADYHPNLKTHAKMAAKLEEALKADLKW